MWYKHILPGCDNSFIRSGPKTSKFGACPISVFTLGFELASHGICNATCPAFIIYGVESYRCMKPFAGIVLPSSKIVCESLATVVLFTVPPDVDILIFDSDVEVV